MWTRRSLLPRLRLTRSRTSPSDRKNRRRLTVAICPFECATPLCLSRRHLHSLQVPNNEIGPTFVPTHPGNGALPGYGLSTPTEAREFLVGSRTRRTR